MSEVKLNLYQKIVEVRKIAEGFNKDGKSHGYTYVTGNQVLSKIKDKMNELNLLLFPSTTMGEHHTHEYKTKSGKDKLDFVVKGEMSYTWINGDEPSEREVISWAYYGQQDDISKAYGSALTYSERYFLLKCLGLPTDEDDPDAKPEKGEHNPTQSPQSNQPTQLSDAQVKRLFAIAKKHMISNDAVKRVLMSDYNKTNVADLTKNEYDEMISRMENKEQKGA